MLALNSPPYFATLLYSSAFTDFIFLLTDLGASIVLCTLSAFLVLWFSPYMYLLLHNCLQRPFLHSLSIKLSTLFALDISTVKIALAIESFFMLSIFRNFDICCKFYISILQYDDFILTFEFSSLCLLMQVFILNLLQAIHFIQILCVI